MQQHDLPIENPQDSAAAEFDAVDIPDAPTRIIACEVDDDEYASIAALARENNMGIPQVLVRAAIAKVRMTPPETRLLFQEMVLLGNRFKDFAKKQDMPVEGMLQEIGIILDKLNRYMSRRKKDWEEDFDPEA